MDLQLTLDEIKAAAHQILKYHQNKFFREEIKLLIEDKPLARNNKLIALNPFVDVKDNLLKVGGRLYQSEIDGNAKHPILLASNSHLTTLIVRYHQYALHAGPQATLYNIRQKYWFTNARNIVRRIIQNCTT